MTKFRDSTLGPTVILFVICFVVTIALAFTYQTTKPVIEQAIIQQADEAREHVLHSDHGFTQITGIELPEGVTEAYKGDDGYVFKSGAKGFSGIVTYVIGISNEGEVVGIEMFESNETPGLGTKVAEHEYLEQYFGTVDPDTVDSITGVTRTTESLRNSLKQAKEAFELVKGE